MLTDGTASRKQQGKAAEDVQVVDVSQVLLRSVRTAAAATATAAEGDTDTDATAADTDAG